MKPTSRARRGRNRSPRAKWLRRAPRNSGCPSSTSPSIRSTAPPSLSCRCRCSVATTCCRSAVDGDRLLLAMADPRDVLALDDVRAAVRMHGPPGRRRRSDLSPRSTASSAPTASSATSRARSARRSTTADALVPTAEADRGRRADRALRQPAHQPGHPGPRVRHPHRARRARHARPLPHRRRAARDAAGAQTSRTASSRGSRSWRHRHRRAPQAAGRPHVGHARRPADRPPRGDPADGVRREGRHAYPRQLQHEHGHASSSACSSATPRSTGKSYTKPYGMILVTGPTGSGKSTTLYTALHAVAQSRDQRHHRRGPGRVPASPASTRCRSTRRPG